MIAGELQVGDYFYGRISNAGFMGRVTNKNTVGALFSKHMIEIRYRYTHQNKVGKDGLIYIDDTVTLLSPEEALRERLLYGL